MIQEITSVDEAITVFIEGARIHHVGAGLGDNKMASRGLKRIREGIAHIDQQSQTARDILIPLLDHHDDAVRVSAASGLIQSRPDRALPVLQQIADHSVTEAYVTASQIFIFKDVFGYYGMGVVVPDPRYPKPSKPDPTDKDRVSLRRLSVFTGKRVVLHEVREQTISASVFLLPRAGEGVAAKP